MALNTALQIEVIKCSAHIPKRISESATLFIFMQLKINTSHSQGFV